MSRRPSRRDLSGGFTRRSKSNRSKKSAPQTAADPSILPKKDVSGQKMKTGLRKLATLTPEKLEKLGRDGHFTVKLVDYIEKKCNTDGKKKAKKTNKSSAANSEDPSYWYFKKLKPSLEKFEKLEPENAREYTRALESAPWVTIASLKLDELGDSLDLNSDVGQNTLKDLICEKAAEVKKLSDSLDERSEILLWLHKWIQVAKIGLWVELEEKCSRLGKPLAEHFYFTMAKVDQPTWCRQSRLYRLCRDHKKLIMCTSSFDSMSRRISFLEDLFSNDLDEKKFWILEEGEKKKVDDFYAFFGMSYNAIPPNRNSTTQTLNMDEISERLAHASLEEEKMPSAEEEIRKTNQGGFTASVPPIVSMSVSNHLIGRN